MLAFLLQKGDADRSGWGIRRRWSVWTRLLSSFAEEERRRWSVCLCADRSGPAEEGSLGMLWAHPWRTLGSEGGRGHGGCLGTQPDPVSSALAPPVPLTEPEGLSLPLKGSSCSE